MFCYIIRNKITKKRYIGITIKTIKDRWYNHKYKTFVENVNRYFYNSIRKYGEENFYFEKIFNYTGLITYEELKEIEIDMISKYNTYYEGYNLTKGGNNSSPVNNKKVKQYSKKLKLINEFNSIKEAAESTGVCSTNISMCCNKKIKSAGSFLWCYDFENPKEYTKNLKKSKILQWDKYEKRLINEFNSIKEASENTGVNKTVISNCCNNRKKSAGGFRWTFLGSAPKNIINGHSKKVIQFKNNIINKFNSIKEASENTGISANGISMCCRGELKSSGGFFWKYLEENK